MNEAKLDSWCLMCGAAPGDPCKVISGEGNEKPGGERRYLHSARGGLDHKPAVTVPDEPPFVSSAPEGVEQAKRERRDPTKATGAALPLDVTREEL